jgi:hypothetical protein
MSTYASVTGENGAANGLTALCSDESLHTASPSTTGANEVTTTGAIYARQATSWASASGGSAATSASQTWTIPASTTVAYTGWWNASTSGTYEFGAPLSASVTFTGQGTYTIASGGATIGATG